MMEDMLKIIVQEWRYHTRYIITHPNGSVQLHLYNTEQEDGITAYIYALYVDKEHRRQGIGKQLLETAENIARDKGHKSVVLDWESEETPRELLDWYMDRGYRVIGAFREEKFTLEKML